MLRTYNSDIDKRIMLFLNDSVKVVKIWHVFAKLHWIIFTNVFLCLQINGKQNTTFQFSAELISNKMHEASLKVILTQRQYADRSN